MKRPPLQVCKKRLDARCLSCGETDYSLLDAHRIVEGGSYDPRNVVTLCCRCHRLAHAGRIRFDRKYRTTWGKWLLHWWEGGSEHWTEVLS